MENVDGVWGPVSATVDWCEDNYVVTRYIAEFWNTVSNIMMILPPLIGAVLSAKDLAENRIVWCHLSLMVVGTGSWLYHMTLLYSMQLMDEMPMIWGSVFLIYALVEVGSPPNSHNRLLQVLLMIYCVLVTLIYIMTHNHIFFEFSYGVMVFTMILASIRIYRYYEHSFPLLIGSIVIYGTGFLMWNIDHLYCNDLKTIRKSIPPMVGPVTQLHAWWHVCAGIGTYLSILFVQHARWAYLRKKPNIQMCGTILPVVHPSLDL